MIKLQKNHTGFGIVETLFAVFMILTIILAGVYIWLVHHKTVSSSSNKGTTLTATLAVSKVARETPEQLAKQTADWNLYVSKLGGFSLSYPSSGWTLETYGDNGWVSGADITNNVPRLWVKEKAGHGLSTSGSQFWINFNIANSASDASSYNGQISNGMGNTLGKLRNGIDIWQSSENTYRHSGMLFCDGGKYNHVVWLTAASNNNLYAPLPNGKYLDYQASFCLGDSGKALNLNYPQQANSPEMTIATEILLSISYRQ